MSEAVSYFLQLFKNTIFHFCGYATIFSINYSLKFNTEVIHQQNTITTINTNYITARDSLLISITNSSPFLCRNCIACIKPDKSCFLNSSRITHVNRDVYNVSNLLAAFAILSICIHKSYFGFTFKTEHFHGCIIFCKT